MSMWSDIFMKYIFIFLQSVMAVGGYLVIIIQSYMTVIEEQYPIYDRPTADKFDEWTNKHYSIFFIILQLINHLCVPAIIVHRQYSTTIVYCILLDMPLIIINYPKN